MSYGVGVAGLGRIARHVAAMDMYEQSSGSGETFKVR
jgi:hypothetical protein